MRRGMLCNKYYSLSRKYQQRGLVRSRYTKRKISVHEENNVDDNNFESCLEDNPDYIWLKVNSSPPDVVIEKWRLTYEKRRKQIESNEAIITFEKWPILRFSIASKLVGFSIIYLKLKLSYFS